MPLGCKLVAMPELPDIAAYITALEARILGQRLERVRLGSVFLLRTAEPPLAAVEGRMVRAVRRIGKRIAIGVESDLPPQKQRPDVADAGLPPQRQGPVVGDPGFPPQRQGPVAGDPGLLWLVLHLMIAGRLHWKAPGAKLGGRNGLAAFDFNTGSLVLTEAGIEAPRVAARSGRRSRGCAAIDPGGVEIFATDLDGFRAALTAGEPHTEAGADRSAADQRRGQCVFRRDSARRAALAHRADRTS